MHRGNRFQGAEPASGGTTQEIEQGQLLVPGWRTAFPLCRVHSEEARDDPAMPEVERRSRRPETNQPLPGTERCGAAAKARNQRGYRGYSSGDQCLEGRSEKVKRLELEVG